MKAFLLQGEFNNILKTILLDYAINTK